MNRANIIEENINHKGGVTRKTYTMENGDIFEEIIDVTDKDRHHIINTLNGVKHGLEYWRWNISHFHKFYYEQGVLIKEELFDNRVFTRRHHKDGNVTEEVKEFPRQIDSY